MSSPALDLTRYPQTASVQKWIDSQRANGLIDFKLFVNPSERTTVETLSEGVLELLNAQAIPGVKLD